MKLRSQAKWTEDGDKNTQNLLNLEKRNSDCNHIKKLIDKDGKEITNLDEIIMEQNFYENLYKTKLKDTDEEKDATEHFLNTNNIPGLSALEKKICN